jgi:hypothetical protein
MLLTLALNTETTPSNNKIFEQTAIYADENQGHGLEQSHNVCRIKTCDALPLPNFELVLPQLI